MFFPPFQPFAQFPILFLACKTNSWYFTCFLPISSSPEQINIAPPTHPPNKSARCCILLSSGTHVPDHSYSYQHLCSGTLGMGITHKQKVVGKLSRFLPAGQHYSFYLSGGTPKDVWEGRHGFFFPHNDSLWWPYQILTHVCCMPHHVEMAHYTWSISMTAINSLRGHIPRYWS